jgi:hypothetical protein
MMIGSDPRFIEDRTDHVGLSERHRRRRGRGNGRILGADRAPAVRLPQPVETMND